MLKEFNLWLGKKQEDSSYKWSKDFNNAEGIIPDQFDCWCETITEYLLSNGWEYNGSDSWDRAQIWTRG